MLFKDGTKIPHIREDIEEIREGVLYPEFVKYTYYSTTAERETNVNILLPPNYTEEKEYPVLYILHGYYDNEDWMARPVANSPMHPGQMEAEEMIFEDVSPYVFLISASKKDYVVTSYPNLCHTILQKNGTEHLWHLMEETGHDHTSVKPHLYNFLRMIFKNDDVKINKN